MKKIISIILIIILITFGIWILCLKNNNKESDLTKITVAEVTHSIFYAPWYVAIEKGYFKEEGIDIDLVLTPGADNVATAVLSNDVQIGFAGIESAIYVYNGGEKDYLVSFAGLTKHDGQFLVSREKNNDFKLEDLENKEVLAGRVGGMPVLNFENALKNNNIDKNKVNINTSVDFADLSSAFISGTGDYVNLFEPNATLLEKQGYGYVVNSIGKLSGEVPYTVFYARHSFIDKNENTIDSFTKAINKGLEYVNNNDELDITKIIIKQFPDTSINDLEKMIKRYKESDSWLSNPIITKKAFTNLEDIMINAGTITEKTNYNKLVNNYFKNK